MLTVGAGVVAFTLVMLALVGVLLAARAMLVPAGEVGIVINGGERELQAPAGDTVLQALTSSDIFLPSACGGQGTCGGCRIQVTEGERAALATEAALITRRELRAGWRLACQMKLREAIEISVPIEFLEVKRRSCVVRSNHNVASFIKELVLDLPEGETMPFRAGAYVQIERPPGRVEFARFTIDEPFGAAWDQFGLRELASECKEPTARAYSMANHPGEGPVVRLNVRIATPPPGADTVPPGVVSSYIFSLEPGDRVAITGPFGDFFAKDTDNEMVFVSGGAGMAPMRSIIMDQFKRVATDRRVSFWYGARSFQEAFYVEDFDELAAGHDNFEWHLALSEPLAEDHWTGDTGFIHQVLYDRYLANHPAPEEIEYYLCGPPLMIAACQRMLDDLGVAPDHIAFDDFGG